MKCLEVLLFLMIWICSGIQKKSMVYNLLMILHSLEDGKCRFKNSIKLFSYVEPISLPAITIDFKNLIFSSYHFILLYIKYTFI
jgi:hypothetical protein